MGIGKFYSFFTETADSTPTNGAAIVVPLAANLVEIDSNCHQFIVNNTDSTETLYLNNWNRANTNVNTANCIQIAPGAYLTLTIGVRSDRVGDDYITAVNTSASATSYTVTQIYTTEQ